MNFAVGVLSVALAARLLPFDVRGFLLISPGLVAFLYGLEQAARGRAFGL